MYLLKYDLRRDCIEFCDCPDPSISIFEVGSGWSQDFYNKNTLEKRKEGSYGRHTTDEPHYFI